MSLAKTNASAFKSLVSLSPLLLLLTSLRSTFGLDNFGLDGIHIGLFQIIVLLFVRGFTGSAPKLELPVVLEIQKEEEEEKVEIKKLKIKVKKVKAVVISPYSPQLLDQTAYNFLSITCPEHLPLLPKPNSETNIKIPSAAGLSEWKVLLDTPELSVLQHPTTKTLYSISASFPTVPIRNLFETLTTVETRLEWDSMCSGSSSIEEIIVGGRKGSVAWLGMKGVAVIKAKDMVLLSVAGQLPRVESEPLRLFCATTSVEHSQKPVDPAYNRMGLSVSGFIAEELAGGGSKVTQITDLSGLGNWVPSAVIRTVTQTMIPKSLTKLGQTAAELDLTKSKTPLEGNDWLPPLLGTSDDSVVAVVEEEEEEEEAEEEIVEQQPKSIVTAEIGSLLTQLRSLTLRLSLLDPARPATSKSTSSTTEFQMSAKSAVSLLSAGGMIGAAATSLSVVVMFAFWGRKR